MAGRAVRKRSVLDNRHGYHGGMATDHPLFIYRYMDRSQPRKDSERFRRRVAAGFIETDAIRTSLAKELLLRAGIELPRNQWNGHLLWDQFLITGNLDEVLTAIEVSIQAALLGPYAFWARRFRSHVELAMREEGLGLRIDEQGLIHYAVDEEFEVARMATLAGLSHPSLGAARSAYEDAFRHLDARPADTKAALRSMFEALEILAKQVSNYEKLNAAVCKKSLKDRATNVLGGDAVQRRVLAGLFDAFAQWVDAMHSYRHGQPDNFERPTEEFTVFALSTGSAYLRLLAQVAVQAGVQRPAT